MKTLFNIGDKITAGDIASYIFDTIRPVVGYSLRKLSNISGPVIRARRSIDNKESDFYADEIEGGELQSFATGDGASDVYVTTWYDQFGNNNATQTTAAEQPKIWDASTGLVTENGKAALDFDGSDDQLLQYYAISRISIFTVLKSDAVSATGGLRFLNSQENTEAANVNYVGYAIGPTGGPGGGNGSINHWNGSNWAAIATDSTITTNQQLLDIIRLAGSIAVFSNGTDRTSSNSRTPIDNTKISIGGPFIFNAGVVGSTYDGKIQEMIMYPSDQSANRETIETNISEYYVIYPMLYLKRITEDSGTFALTDRYELIYNQVSQVSTPSLLCTCDAYKGSSLTTYGTLYNIIPE